MAAKKKIEWRDRYAETVIVPAGDILPHPKNPKIHPANQLNPLTGLLEEVGKVDALKAYRSEREGGKLVYWDGHARMSLRPDERWRVDVYDLTDSEVDLLLATFDPVGWQAEQSRAKLETLMADISTSNADVMEFLNRCAEEVGITSDNDQNEDDNDLDELPDDAIGGIASVYQLKNGAVFPASNEYGIPDLLPDLIAKCPADIKVWADSKSEPSENYLVIHHKTSQKGLNRERAILGFYTHDSKFENCWYQTGEVVEKIIAQRWQAVIAPNFSLWSHQPRLIQMWQVYRSRWVARYLQGAGVPIIPDVDWIDNASFDFNLLGIPAGLPCVSIQCQTNLVNAQEEQQRADGIARIVDLLKPGQLLVYGANDDWQSRIAKIVDERCQVIHVESLTRRLRRHFKE